MFKRLFGVFSIAVLITVFFLACSNDLKGADKNYEYHGNSGITGVRNVLRYSVTLRGTEITSGTVEKRGERYVISMKWLKTYQGKAEELEVSAVGDFSGDEETDIYLLFQSDGQYQATNISDWRGLRQARNIKSIRNNEEVEITQGDMNIVAEKFQAAFDEKTDLATVIPEAGNGVKLVDNYPVVIVNPGDIDLIDYDFKSKSVYEPKLSCLVYKAGKIYVGVQFLDMHWNPQAKSEILEVDAQTGNVLRNFESNFTNVAQIVIRGNDLFVVDMGAWSPVADGGITKFNLTSGTKTTIFTGTNGLDPSKIEFVNDNKGYLLMVDDCGMGYIAEFNFNGSKMALNYNDFENYDMAVVDISYNGETDVLWIGTNLGGGVFKYSVSENAEILNLGVTMPVYSIKSAGNTTVTVESDWMSAGIYGVISNDRYTSKLSIDQDAVCDFVDGNFYILERTNGVVFTLSPTGERIKQTPLTSGSRYFNPQSIVGDGNGNLWVCSYDDLIIEVLK